MLEAVKLANCFRKKAPSRISDRVLYTPLLRVKLKIEWRLISNKNMSDHCPILIIDMKILFH